MEGKNESKHTRFGCQRNITLSSNVIMFLAEYIHGLENGKADDKTKLTFQNAKDQFYMLLSNNGAPALLEENEKLKTKIDRLSFVNKTLEDATVKLQAEIEQVQKENERLQEAKDHDEQIHTAEVDRLTKEKSEAIEFIKSRIADSFRCLENGMWEHYPFDSHSREGLLGMKDGYSDILKELTRIK